MRHIMRSAVFAGLALALAGCADAEALHGGLNPLQEAFGWNAEKLARVNWLAPLPYTPEPRYCYRTLAAADCYVRPQPDATNRLVGYAGPPPY